MSTCRTCPNCQNPLTKAQIKYCSRSCAVSVNNKKPKRLRKTRACAYCGTLTGNPKYCSIDCQLAVRYAAVVLNLNETGRFPSEAVARRYLIRTYGLKCWQCGITEWNGKELPVVLDHINGHAEDNSTANLRLLCCNCDAQTDTYKGKNVGKGRAKRMQRYRDGKSY